MTCRLLLIAAAAAASFAAPAMAGSDSGQTTICHRTGSQATRSTSLFPGQVITVSDGAVAQHVGGHGDVVVGPDGKRGLGSGRSCFTDAKGNLYSGGEQLVQPVPGAVDPGQGADEGGPG